MLACDLIMDVRASRVISADQVDQLERLVFTGEAPNREQLALLYLINTYLQRPDARMARLLDRAIEEATAPTDAAEGKASAEFRAH